MNKTVSSPRIALEHIQLSLNTVTQLGDVVITLSPAISLIKAIRERLTSMIPDGYQSLTRISDILTTIIGESDQVPIREIAGSIALNEDSCKITEGADTTVEHTIKNKLPNLPDPIYNEKR